MAFLTQSRNGDYTQVTNVVAIEAVPQEIMKRGLQCDMRKKMDKGQEYTTINLHPKIILVTILTCEREGV